MRVVCCWWVLAALVCGWPHVAHAQLVQPLAESAIELTNKWDAAPIDVPLNVLDRASLSGASVQRVEAAGRQQPALQEGFGAKLHGSRLKLETHFYTVRIPRSYKLWIELVGTQAPAEGAAVPARQLVSVEMVLPPATLEPLQPFVVNHAQWPWGSAEGHGPELELPLHETSGTTSLSRLTLTLAHPVLNGDLQVPTTLVPVLAPNDLGAGARKLVRFKAQGLEVGTTKGSLMVGADQLLQPLQVPFEIRTKVFDWLIMPWYLLFGLLGWLVRHRLQEAGARAELRAQSEALLKRVRAEAEELLDEKLGILLRNASNAVEAALEEPDNQALASAVTALGGLLGQVTTKRGEELDQLLSNIAQREDTLTVPFDLPAGLRLDRAKAALAKAKGLLLEGKPREAREAFEQQDNQLNDLRARIDAWSRDTERALTLFEQTGSNALNVPDTVRAPVSELLKTLGAALDKAHYNPTRPPPLREYLAGAHDANLALRRLFSLVKSAFADQLEEAARILADAKVDAGAIVAALAKLPAEALDVTEQQLRALVSAMKAGTAAIESTLTALEATDLFKEGKLAQAVVKELALQGKTQRVLISATNASGAVAVTAGAPLPQAGPGPAPQVILMRAPARLPDAPALALALSELRALQVTRNLVSASILSVVAWMLYRQTWTGTVSDFAGVAAIAFITDLTLDAALDAVSKVKKPSPA